MESSSSDRGLVPPSDVIARQLVIAQIATVAAEQSSHNTVAYNVAVICTMVRKGGEDDLRRTTVLFCCTLIHL